jgi:putative lumazine-binding protein
MRRLSALVLLALPAALAAQNPAAPAPPAPPPQPAYSADSAAVVGVITKLFDGMRARDTAAMHGQFHEAAVLRSASFRQGQHVIEADAIGDWLNGVAGAPAGRLLDERLGPLEVRVDGNLAGAWVYYEFYADDRFSHCGVDAFHLGRTADGWKIMAVSDSRRRQGCAQSLGKK